MKIDPLGDGVSCVEYIQHVGSDKMIINAARVSYDKDEIQNIVFNDKDRSLLKYLLDNEHLSPLEHTLISFRVTAPLYVVQEMLRHRIGVSFNQVSHRYTEPDKREKLLRKFYKPLKLRGQSQSNKQSSTEDFEPTQKDYEQYEYACNVAFDVYEKLINNGICREQARGVLPHSTYTSLYITFNLRSLTHFLKLRLSPNAQWEIQQYAKAFFTIAKSFFPETFSLLNLKTEGKPQEVAISENAKAQTVDFRNPQTANIPPIDVDAQAIEERAKQLFSNKRPPNKVLDYALHLNMQMSKRSDNYDEDDEIEKPPVSKNTDDLRKIKLI